MSAERNKETIVRIYEALAEGDATVFGNHVDTNYVWRHTGQSSWSGKFEGREAIQRDLLRPLFSRFSTPYRASLLSAIAEGEKVVAEVRGDVLTHQGDRYDNHYCFIFTFQNGRISEVVEYCDSELEERVLGRYDDVVKALDQQPPG